MEPKFNPGTNTLAKLAKVRTRGIFDVMVEKQTQPTLFSFQKKKDKPDQVKPASKSKALWNLDQAESALLDARDPDSPSSPIRWRRPAARTCAPNLYPASHCDTFLLLDRQRHISPAAT